MNQSALKAALAPKKRKKPPLTDARLRELKRQQRDRWNKPGQGTDRQGNPY